MGQVEAAQNPADSREPAGASPSAHLVRHSLLSYSPGLLLVAIMVVDATRIVDPDLWGHLRFGQEILRTHHLARVDPYAYSVRGLPWVSHEWLSEVVIAAFFDAMGMLGLNLMKLLCSAALVLCMAAAMTETGASTLTQFAILMIAGVRLSPSMQYRPQIFTYAMLAALLALLARDNFGRRAPLWLAIPMFALWANLHGGFVVGLGVLAMYAAISVAQDWWGGRGFRRAARLGGLWAACVLATLLTPYGIGTWRAVAHTVGNPGMLGVINEWKPLLTASLMQWHGSHLSIIYDLSIVIIFGGLVVAVILEPRGGDFALVAIAAVLIAASFEQVRNVPLGMIAAAVPLARHTSLALRARRERLGQAPENPPERATAFNQAVLVTIAIVLAVETRFFSRTPRFDQSYPAGAIAFMKLHQLNGNMLCDYGWNDYVLYHMAPNSHVFIDSRYEMIYPRRIIHDFLDFELDRPGASAMLAKYPHDYVLIPVNARAAPVMKHAAGWTLIYRNRDCLLYARSDFLPARVPRETVVGTPPAPRFP
jgi:hypothetical protein